MAVVVVIIIVGVIHSACQGDTSSTQRPGVLGDIVGTMACHDIVYQVTPPPLVLQLYEYMLSPVLI